MSDDKTVFTELTVSQDYKHIWHIKDGKDNDLLHIYISKTGRSVRVFKKGKELK